MPRAAGGALAGAAGWLLPLLVVLLFVHISYQPTVAVHGVDVGAGDVVLWLAVLASLPRLRALGSSRVVLALVALFLLYALADTLFAAAPSYNLHKHGVTWAKFTEFALIVAIVPALGDRGVVRRVAWTTVGVAIAAAVVAIVQFGGAHIFAAWGRWNREPSFTGVHELGTLGAVTLAVAFVARALPGLLDDRIVVPALAAGLVCTILSGAVAAGLGLAAATALVLFVALRRRALTRSLAVLVLAAAFVGEAGIVVMRGGDITQFARYVGIAKKEQSTTSNVQTYAQRSLLAYIGLRVWRDRPVFGAGWQSIREPSVFEPQLPAARAKFPDQPPLAFPSRAHPWGIDDAYIESLAELGLVGLVLLLAPLAAGTVAGVRRALRGPAEPATVATLGTACVFVAAGVWTGQPLTVAAFTDVAWLGLGLVALAEVTHV
jgi:hypothetical protein